jgi:hypothetical protein
MSREPIEPAVSVATVIKKTTTMSPDNKETLQLVPLPPSDHQHSKDSSVFYLVKIKFWVILNLECYF